MKQKGLLWAIIILSIALSISLWLLLLSEHRIYTYEQDIKKHKELTRLAQESLYNANDILNKNEEKYQNTILLSRDIEIQIEEAVKKVEAKYKHKIANLQDKKFATLKLLSEIENSFDTTKNIYIYSQWLSQEHCWFRAECIYAIGDKNFQEIMYKDSTAADSDNMIFSRDGYIFSILYPYEVGWAVLRKININTWDFELRTISKENNEKYWYLGGNYKKINALSAEERLNLFDEIYHSWNLVDTDWELKK